MAHSTFVTLHIVLAPSSLHYTFHQLAPSERIDKRKLLTPDYPLPQPVCGGGSGWGGGLGRGGVEEGVCALSQPFGTMERQKEYYNAHLPD